MLKIKRQTIMLVDDNQANLSMGKNMLKDLYEVYALPSAERLFAFLKTVTPDLILLDIEMPTMNGFDVIRILKGDARHMDIPVIFVTSKTEEMNELEGLSLGAADYVTKPFSAAILVKRIENQLLIKKQKNELKGFNENLVEMVKEKTVQVIGLQNSIINSISDIVEFRDAFTGGHIVRTQRYMQLLIDYLLEHNLYPDEFLQWENIDYIVTSSQLHDLGKVFINDSILNKPGKLTSEEFEIMKTHAARGVEAIRKMKNRGPEQSFLDYAEIIASSHHEKWNGSGYPSGLKGQDIPLLGRLMAIADVYDALTNTRPYKEAFSAKESAKIIVEGAGTHFDPALVDVFIKLEDEFALVCKTTGDIWLG
jgi:putative two-component system response regulator